jgi:serine/threonine-protein kinase
VTDFGIALSQEYDGLTKTGRVLGTTDYVSPEQAMGRDIDARSDIYSLGILIYEMLMGDVPFKAETLVGVAMKHVNDPLPDVQRRRPGVSSALAAVVERSTQKDPKKRYPDMGAMLADLEGALEVEIARSGGGTGEATTVLDSVPSRQRLLSSRTVSIAGILLVLAGVLAALALVEIGGEPESRPRDEGPSSPPSGGEIQLSRDASDFDPPPGDGTEHTEEVGLAVDGNPGTYWATETYNTSADMEANGKPGVGLVVDADDVVPGRNLVITTENPGWAGEIYGAAEGPPEDLAGWGEPIGEFTTDEEETTVSLDTNDSRHYLIWITQLTDNPDGGFFATIGNVDLTD